MKIFLDENPPHGLRRAGAGGCKVMLMKDDGVQYELHQPTLPVAVFAMKAKTNKLDDTRPLLPRVLVALAKIQPRSFIRVG